MTYFNYINSNLERIKYEVDIGLIPILVLRHWQIYSRYDYYRKLKYGVRTSVFYTGEDMKVSENWVYIIIKRMEKEV